jgi:hypothetical protein
MQSESIFDVSKSHVSAIDLYDALAEISIFHLQDALAAESLDLTVGPQPYLRITYIARKPSFQLIFLPS